MIGNGFVITNGGFPDELTVWLFNSPSSPKSPTEAKNLDSMVLFTKSGSWNEVYAEIENINTTADKSETADTVISTKYTLSESKALKRFGLDVPPFRDIKSVFMDPDQSTIFACTSQPNGGIDL